MTLLSSQLGLMIVIRTLRSWHGKSLLSKDTLAKIGVIYFAFLFFVLLIFATSSKASVLLLAPALGLILGERLLFYRCRKKLYQSLFPFIEAMVLRMKIGQGFRTAYGESLNSLEDSFSRKKLEEMYQSVVFSQQNDSLTGHGLGFLDQCCQEFRKVDRQGHLAIERLENLKRRLKIETHFRRKSGQVLAQVHLQGLLLALIYLLLLAFVTFQFGLKAHWKWVSFSAVLFLFGGLWLFYLGRGMRWRL